MKKYKLELAIGSLFAGLIVAFLWSTLESFYSYLPFILAGLAAVALIVSLTPAPDGKNQGGEKYAPVFFAKSVLASVIGIALVIAVAVVFNRDRFSKSFDLTERKINSLSEETLKFVSSITEDVAIFCVPSMDPRENYCNENSHLRTLFSQASSKIQHTVINPADAATLQRVRPAGYSRLVLITADDKRSEIVGAITESKLTNALINLIKSKRTVYFLSGTGEPPLSPESERNYAILADILKNRAYDVKEHPLADGDLPEDAQLVVAGGTSVAYSSAVDTLLRKFLARGGRLLLVTNPYRPLGLDRLLADVGLKLNNNLLVGNGGVTQLGAQLAQLDAMRPPIVGADFSRESAITNVLSPRDVGIFDGAREIALLDGESALGLTLKHTKLMSALHAAPITLDDTQRSRIPEQGPLGVSPAANFDPAKAYHIAYQVEIENAEKLAEGIPVATLASKDGSGTGDSGNALTSNVQSEVVLLGFEPFGRFERMAPANTQIMPLAVAHLYRDKELISIPNKDFAPRSFKPERNAAGYLFLFAGLLPLLTALTGIYIGVKRRSA